MGQTFSIQKINFEDVQFAYKNKNNFLLINTMLENKQDCLINNTIIASSEEQIINTYLTMNRNIKIIVYGINTNDDSIHTKYNQLLKLGFKNIFIYLGGMFEWLMLQDIYGYDEFPTTKKELDFLKYKPCSKLNTRLIEN